MKSRLTRGLVQIYTGDGKGKSTAAWGLALRAAGRGLRVCFVMFMKGDTNLGELRAVQALVGAGPCARPCEAQPPPDAQPLPLTVRQFGAGRAELAARSEGEWWKADFTADDRRMAREGFAFACAAVAGGEYDVVVLDEINVALDLDLLPVGEVLDLLAARPPHVEVVLTGRHAPAELIAAADLVTEMRLVKHPFNQGIGARPGIEF